MNLISSIKQGTFYIFIFIVSLIQTKYYESNQVHQNRGILQGNLSLRELMINGFFFPQPPSSLASDHNPSYPGVVLPPPLRLGFQDNGIFGVAWVIYRIQM